MRPFSTSPLTGQVRCMECRRLAMGHQAMFDSTGRRSAPAYGRNRPRRARLIVASDVTGRCVSEGQRTDPAVRS